MNSYPELEEMLKKHDRIVFFGGAGVSTESGIPDFRSSRGIYSEKFGTLSPEEIVSASFFRKHPAEFYDFYKSKMIFPDAKPNDAHLALAALEKAGKLSCVITQNIDGLHQDAGSKKVYELHGSVRRNYCMKCGKRFGLDHILGSACVPKCDACGGTVRPDVTLYEESLPDGVLDESLYKVASADMLIIAGSSLMVQPAASLIYYFRGSDSVLINLSATPADSFAKLAIAEPVGKVLGTAVRNIGIEF